MACLGRGSSPANLQLELNIDEDRAGVLGIVMKMVSTPLVKMMMPLATVMATIMLRTLREIIHDEANGRNHLCKLQSQLHGGRQSISKSHAYPIFCLMLCPRPIMPGDAS